MNKEYRIMHVDDDEDDLQLLKRAFENLGKPYKLVQAGNGEECLAKLGEMLGHEELPCLIVLDINMPRMDGKETFVNLRKNPKFAGIPIIIFSTSNSAMDRLFFRGQNVEYMVKPIDFKMFSLVADHMLDICDR